MKIKKRLIIFAALIILLVGAASATDVSDDATDTVSIIEETVQQTQTATDINNIATQDNEEKDVETDINTENVVSATQGIQKKANKANTKEATAVSTWYDLKQKIENAEDTHFTLTRDLTNTGTIKLNKGKTITIDGNGKTINGAQNQVFEIKSGSTLILKNLTITNATSNYGGAIYNSESGTLSITDSTLENNIANKGGGVIYNMRTLNITDSTLENNTANNGGAIENYGGTLTITHTTLNNNTANIDGGAIYNSESGTLSITDSTLNNNTANNGGAINNKRREYFNVINSNFTKNHANKGGAIWSYGYANLTGNIFSENSATDNNETIDLEVFGTGEFKDNQYKSTDISLNRIELSLKDDKQTFMYGDDIELKLTLEPKNSHYYYNEISEAKIDRTIYINGEENVTTTSDSYTLSNLKLGTYTLYYTSCNQRSNTVTIIIVPKQKDVNNYTQLIDAINEAKNKDYTTYTINLHPGNYNATNTTDWGNSATRNIIINGNGITLNGNNTYQFIKISNEHNNLTLNNVTITNYTADFGGAILNYGTLTITYTTFVNNTAKRGGGAIVNSRDDYFTVINSNFIQNHAKWAAAIYSRGFANLTGNIFFENTATDHNETIDLLGCDNGIFKDNHYKSTDILLNRIELSLKDDKQTFMYGKDIELNLTLEPKNSINYYHDISEAKIDRTLFINGEENITTTGDSYTLSNLKPGTYTLYYTSCNQQSNTVTFKILGPKQKDVYNYTQLRDAITEAKTEEYPLYTINLQLGNYNATNSTDWGDSATRNIIINGNGITLDGNNTYQFIIITDRQNNLTLNNVTITNYKGYYGGAIRNMGTLIITDSTLTNNNATQDGGAIYNNGGRLYITDSTLNNNTSNYGGAITNDGTLNITHTTLNNNTANRGGAIRNAYGGKVNISYSTLNGNHGLDYGGAIIDWTNSRYDNHIVLFYSNFTENKARQGAAIYNDGNYGTYDMTYNLFRNNTAEEKETLSLGDKNRERTVKENTYDNTDIKLKTINLTVMDEQQQFTTEDDVKLKFTLELENPDNYDDDVLKKLNKTLYINDKQIVTTNSTNYTLSNLKPGNYSLNYTSCNQQSNTVTFKVIGNSEITTPDDSYDYYDGVKNTVALNINDPSGEKGTADIYVKDGDKYWELLSCQNVDDGYTLLTETLKDALENLYDGNLEDSYTINITYISNNDYVTPSSTEFTLNIIKQRNTTITYDIINNTEGNVQINIMVLDNVYRTPVPDAAVKITGDINQNTTTGVITDNTLTPGDYKINVEYEENAEYKASVATIDFTVEIDKDKKISELENNFTNLTNQLDEKQKELEDANKIINTLNETNKNLTRKLEEAKEQITALTNTITDLNKEIKTLNDTINNLTEQLREAENKISFLNNANDELTKELEDANKIIETLNNKINNFTKQLTEANKEIETLNNVNYELTKEFEASNKEIETLNNKINNLTEQLKDANNEINSLINENGELVKDLETANNEIQTLNDTINDLTNQLTEAINQMSSLTDKVNNLTKQLEDADKEINDKNNEIQTLSDTINSLTEQLDDAKEKIENLNKIIDELLNKKPLNTTITINPIKSGIGEIATLTANIIAENGDRVTGGKAVFKVNGITLKDENSNVIYATVIDGTASINYKVQDVWMKSTSTVQAVYGGTEKYAQSRTNASDVLDISKGKTTIALEKDTVTAKAGQTLTLKATVLDANGDRINTGKVVFKLNGKTLKDDNGEVLYAYVKDGQALLDYTIPGIYSAKAYQLTAVFGGGNYERAETSGTLMLERKAVTINADKITTKNNKTTIKATITDETGKLLAASTKLAIKINGKTVLNNVTSTNGKIDVSFTLPLRPGMYELTIISGENGLYKKGTRTTVLKI